MSNVCQIVVKLPRVADNTCCGVHDPLQLVRHRFRHTSQQAAAIVNAAGGKCTNSFWEEWVQMVITVWGWNDVSREFSVLDGDDWWEHFWLQKHGNGNQMIVDQSAVRSYSWPFLHFTYRSLPYFARPFRIHFSQITVSQFRISQLTPIPKNNDKQ